MASAMDFLVNDGWCNHDIFIFIYIYIYIYIYARALLRKCVWFSYYLIYLLYQWLQKLGCHSSQVICTEDADEHPYAHTASCHTELDGKCLGIIRRWQHLLTMINPSLPIIKHDYPILTVYSQLKCLKLLMMDQKLIRLFNTIILPIEKQWFPVKIFPKPIHWYGHGKYYYPIINH